MDTLKQELLYLLKKNFNYDEFRFQQLEIITSVIKGHDTLVLMPTGGGKSLCYQIPALYFEGLTVVISPLISLMKDQVDQLNAQGIPAAYLNSSLDIKTQEKIQEDVFFGKIKLLYISPERMMSKSLQELFFDCELALFAIDEAHCVSSWGHDFRPEYRDLSLLGELYPNIPKIALTATAGRVTRDDIVENLQMNNPDVYVSSFDRPNLELNIQKKTTKQNDYKKLYEFIADRFFGETGVVYCLSRKKTQEVAQYLTQKGIKAQAYHAGLSSRQRLKIHDEFLSTAPCVVVATIAFGMGIDKSNVRFVAHMDMPKSIESYYQEIGRAGRDGLPAVAWLIYGKRDVVTLKMMMNKKQGVRRQRVNNEKLESMLGLCESVYCRREVLLRYFDDNYVGPCENCDNCFDRDLEQKNMTPESLIALKAVHITQQKKDIKYLVDLLVGNKGASEAEKSEIFEAGKHLDENNWFALYRQLIAQGILKTAENGKVQTILTPRALEVLTKKREVYVRVEKSQKQTRKKTAKKSRVKNSKQLKLQKAALTELSEFEQFEYLKNFRKLLAKKKRTKAYKIFPDKTLEQFIFIKPKSLEQMESIYGVGPKKIKKYGKDFLDVIRQMS